MTRPGRTGLRCFAVESAVEDDDPILAEQQAYYRARAREYDKWFRREGLHDLGEEDNARWRLELDRVFSALDADFAPRSGCAQFE